MGESTLLLLRFFIARLNVTVLGNCWVGTFPSESPPVDACLNTVWSRLDRMPSAVADESKVLKDIATI